MEKRILIEGMKCMHCKANVENALKSVDGVTDAVADLETKTATVKTSVEIEDVLLMEAVRKKGFIPVKIL